MKLRCYCCGEKIPLSDAFLMVTLSDTTVDRVFIAKEEHAQRFDSMAIAHRVIRMKSPVKLGISKRKKR